MNSNDANKKKFTEKVWLLLLRVLITILERFTPDQLENAENHFVCQGVAPPKHPNTVPQGFFSHTLSYIKSPP